MTDGTGRASHWSEPLEFTVTAPELPIPQVGSLRITEVMYHPVVDGDFEFVEVGNVGAEPVDLTGVRLGAGIEFSFEGSAVTSLGPGEFVVVPKSIPVFEARYGSGIRVAGEYSGSLSNAGEEVSLLYGHQSIHSFVYDDAWYPKTDGAGHSLVPVDPGGSPSSWNDPSAWRESLEMLGSPGRADVAGPAGGLVRPGDLTLEGRLDISDAIALLGYLFRGDPASLPCGDGTPAAPGSAALADADGDGKVNLTDPIHVLQFLFQGGPPPALGTECVLLEGCPDACAP
jgi:hypothetical protein